MSKSIVRQQFFFICRLEIKGEDSKLIAKTKKSDRRVRRTKKLLKQSFIELLKYKPYDQITVKDIVEKADYNRTTFYNHYKYKEELVDEIVNEVIDGLMIKTENFFKSNYYYIYTSTSCKISAITTIIFDYVCEKKDLFVIWKYSEAIPGLYERFLQAMITILKKACRQYGKEEKHLNHHLFATFYAYGIMGLIMQWIKNDFTASPKYMANQCKQIVKQ